jgi:hypothetical protein
MSAVLHPAIVLRAAGQAPRLAAKSAEFDDAWAAPLLALCEGFGDRPIGVACPAAIFAHRLGRRHVAVVEVRDAGPDLRFDARVLLHRDYVQLGGDPFAIAERFPPTDELVTFAALAPLATTASLDVIRGLLQRTKAANGTHVADGPTLLGGVQVLVDGGKLIAERSAPDPAFVRAIWTLLPIGSRARLWPTSFAFSTALGFDVAVVPRLEQGIENGYLTEQQAGDYPAGSYELALQTAVEDGDEAEVRHLLSRPPARPMKLGMTLLLAVTVLAVTTRWILPPPAKDVAGRAAAAVAVIGVRDPFLAAAILAEGNRIFGEQP